MMFLREVLVPKRIGFRVVASKEISKDLPDWEEFEVSRNPIEGCLGISLKERSVCVLRDFELLEGIQKVISSFLLEIPLTMIVLEYSGKEPNKIFISKNFFKLIRDLPVIVFYPKDLEEFAKELAVCKKFSEETRIPTVVYVDRSLEGNYESIDLKGFSEFLGDYEIEEAVRGGVIEEEDFERYLDGRTKDIFEKMKRVIDAFEKKVGGFGGYFIERGKEGEKIWITVGGECSGFESFVRIKLVHPFPKESLRKVIGEKEYEFFGKAKVFEEMFH